MVLEDFIRFSNNSAGFEKILKGSQGLCQIFASPAAKSYLISNSKVSKGWGQAQQQLGLGRRFVRFLWFLDSAMKTEESRKGTGGGILKILITSKWACFAVFTFSEACTVLHAMGIRQTRFTTRFHRIGMKFWFFSICFSILASLTQLMPHMLDALNDPDLDMAFGSEDAGRAPRGGLFEGPSLSDYDPRDPRASGYDPRADPRSATYDPRYDPRTDSRGPAYDARTIPGPSNYNDPRVTNGHPSGGRVSSRSNSSSPTRPALRITSPPNYGPRIDAEMERKKLFIDASKNTPAAPPTIAPIIMQLFADVCDLTIPGANVGWFKCGPEVVGAAYMGNAILGGKVIWDRVNTSAPTTTKSK